MNAEELVRILDTWTDAMNVAELVGSPFLRVSETWDLQDWQAIDLPDGLKFQHVGREGAVTEEVVVVGEAPQKEVCGPTGGDAPVRTWFLRVGVEPRRRKLSGV
jgi:hypothetical protein